MPFSLKQDEDAARARLRAFWAGSSLGRPALLVEADNPAFVETPWRGPSLDAKERDLLPEWHAHEADNNLRRPVRLAESMPSAGVDWGSNLIMLAALAGGDYEYHGGSAWIRPMPDVYDRPLPAFDPHHPVVRSVELCLRRVAQVVGDRGYLNPPALLDAMTTVSQFREPDRLCLDLVDRPHDVQRWFEALTRLYSDTYEHFYGLVRSLGYGDSSSWLGTMAEGRFEAVQCDFATMVSPAMFERFVLPHLAYMTERLDYSLYHLDGTCQVRFLDLLRTLPRLSGIQWNPEPGAGSPLQWLDALRAIRRHGFCLTVWCGSAQEATELTRALGPDGLLLTLPRFKTEGEAREAIRAVERCA